VQFCYKSILQERRSKKGKKKKGLFAHMLQNAMVAHGKGLLAADESTGTIGSRFEKIGVANTLENRISYREALFNAPAAQLSEYIGGVILYEETLESKGSDGRLLVDLLKDRKIILGIKTDKGTK
jgi:fructose-bisphosphate aldolase class I